MMAGPSVSNYNTRSFNNYSCPSPWCGQTFFSASDVQDHLTILGSECGEWIRGEEGLDGELHMYDA